MTDLTLLGYAWVSGGWHLSHSSPKANVYIFELFDQFSAAVPLMCIVFTELIAVSWIYGVDRFIADIELMIDRKLSRWWWYMWKWVTPLLLGFILTWNFINEMVEPRQYATAEGLRPFPPWATFFGWVLILSSVLWIPGVAIWRREHIHISRSDVIGCFSLVGPLSPSNVDFSDFVEPQCRTIFAFTD